MHRVFVYGTLKKGFSNHGRIFGGYDIKITPAWALGKLYDLGWYPAMTVGTDNVFGELIEFNNPEILKRVDYLEGFKGVNIPHNYYERREVDVFAGDGTVKAWVYFLSNEKINGIDSELIVSGSWK